MGFNSGFKGLIRRTKAVLETQGSEQRKKVGKERRKVTQRKKRTPEKERKTINVQLKVKSQRTIARGKRNE